MVGAIAFKKTDRVGGIARAAAGDLRALDARGSAAVLRDLGPGFDEGALRAPAIADRYPLEQAGTAYARVESGEAAGRVLLLMS